MERVDDRTDNTHKTCCGDLLKNMPQNNKYYQNKFYIVKTVIASFNCSVHYYSPFCFSCGDAASEKNRPPEQSKGLIKSIMKNYLFENCHGVKKTVLRTVFSRDRRSCAPRTPQWSLKRKLQSPCEPWSIKTM